MTNSLSGESYIGAKSEDNSMHLRPQGNQLVTSTQREELLLLVEIALPVLVKVIPPIEIVCKVAGAGSRSWFFLAKSIARTISLSSATSDETAWVEEFVLTLATMP
ncbi:hypothetical protein Tco_1055824 [Tanacetum coccineum]|uniref:Uncharacterized protein n=1 Tax=Tanacetum coccineum TaxID=301880 RepID=A0ABQ5H0S0_9ASTR